MRTTELRPNMADNSKEMERGELAAITGEIAVRLIEMAEVSNPQKVMQWVQKLSAVSKADHKAFWMLIRIWSGDMSELTMSYSQQGAKETRSKQACQQEMERILRVLDETYPGAAESIKELRCVTAKWKDAA
jgi:hypothetical protein